MASVISRSFTEIKSVGKKLNFISQEIGREINTIGSKCSDFKIQRSSYLLMRLDILSVFHTILFRVQEIGNPEHR